MGHAGEASATENYGRPRRDERGSGGLLIAHPDADEVKCVHKKLHERLLRLDELHHEEENRSSSFAI